MIKVRRLAPPIELNADKALELTAIFITDQAKSPWNSKFIRDRLLEMSYGKCVYCETRIDEESKYMEVDHYYCKSAYPARVVDWSNLLPTCKRCNVRKGSHDVGNDGDIIDPTVDTPANHLLFWNYRLFGQDEKGTRSIEVLYLNETNRLVSARADIGSAVAKSFEELKILADECLGDITQNRKINRLERGFIAMLEEALPPSQFSATAATLISSHPHYYEVKIALNTLHRWSNELASLESRMLEAALPVV